jgi:hypothetical protein
MVLTLSGGTGSLIRVTGVGSPPAPQSCAAGISGCPSGSCRQAYDWSPHPPVTIAAAFVKTKSPRMVFDEPANFIKVVLLSMRQRMFKFPFHYLRHLGAHPRFLLHPVRLYRHPFSSQRKTSLQYYPYSKFRASTSGHKSSASARRCDATKRLL